MRSAIWPHWIENPDGSLSRTDRLGNLTRIEYDADRRPTRLELPGGGVATTTYDPDGNPSTVTDPLGNTTTYAWDSTNVRSASPTLPAHRSRALSTRTATSSN